MGRNGTKKLNKVVRKNEIVNSKKAFYNHSANGITLIALVVTTIFSYDENSKFSNNKGFLLKAI